MSTTASFSLSAAVAVLAGLSLAACSGSNGNIGDGGPNPLGCPSSPPSGGSCSLASGTTCTYGNSNPCGGGTVVVCSNGQWQFEVTGGAPSGAGACCGAGGGIMSCPATIPAQGSPCNNGNYCGGAQPSCSYGCDQGGPAYATCNGSTWTVEYSGIACSVDAGDGGGAEGGEGGDAADAQSSCHAQAECGSTGYCAAPGGPYLTGYALGVTCTGDADCSADASGVTCNGGACVCQSTQYSPRPQPGAQAQGYCMATCTTTADCAGSTLGPLYGDGSGFVCGAGGHCVPAPCASTAGCPANFVCAANQCVRRSCATDGDCTPAGACVDGACYPGAGTCEGLPV